MAKAKITENQFGEKCSKNNVRNRKYKPTFTQTDTLPTAMKQHNQIKISTKRKQFGNKKGKINV